MNMTIEISTIKVSRIRVFSKFCISCQFGVHCKSGECPCC